MKLSPILFAGLSLALASIGCSHKDAIQPVATPTPASTPTAASTPVAKLEPDTDPRRRYLVRKGDTLWGIASKQGVLDDPFLWPLLYKQNRDQLQDPDTIEIDQDLSYGAHMDSLAINDAIQKAKDTPAFVPHDGPRKQLPLKY